MYEFMKRLSQVTRIIFDNSYGESYIIRSDELPLVNNRMRPSDKNINKLKEKNV